MTVSPDAPPLVFGDLADAVKALRESGRRLSTARRLVLEALFAADGPVSATHLARALSIDESSVYRNLEVLEQHGLIRHVHLGHSPGLYVLVADREVEYLYCSRCAAVTPVAPERLDTARREIKREFGYDARFTHFAIVGTCEPCSAKATSRARPGTGSEIHAEDVDGHHHHGDPRAKPRVADEAAHEHTHSHGDFVHSHPHVHGGPSGRHQH